MRALTFCCLAAALALPGCSYYNYQPTALRVPLADTAGQADVYAASGLTTTFAQLSAGGQYGLGRRFTVGAQGSYYTAGRIDTARDIDFINVLVGPFLALSGGRAFHVYHLERSGYSYGANVGLLLHAGTTSFHLQAGTDLEGNRRAYTLALSDSSRADIASRARYVKPWLQASMRIRLSQQRPENGYYGGANLVLGVRVSEALRWQAYAQSTGQTGAEPILDLFTSPERASTMADYLLGVEGALGRVWLFGHMQIQSGPANWHYSPTLAFRAGASYRLGGARRQAVGRPGLY